MTILRNHNTSLKSKLNKYETLAPNLQTLKIIQQFNGEKNNCDL